MEERRERCVWKEGKKEGERREKNGLKAKEEGWERGKNDWLEGWEKKQWKIGEKDGFEGGEKERGERGGKVGSQDGEKGGGKRGREILAGRRDERKRGEKDWLDGKEENGRKK